MTAQDIINGYSEGRKTPGDVVRDLLKQTDKALIVEAMRVLPSEVLSLLKSVVSRPPEALAHLNPRPSMEIVAFVKRELDGLGHRRGLGSQSGRTRTVPVGEDAEFQALQNYANAELRERGYVLMAKHGSSSWIDPADRKVRFKLAKDSTGIFFGVRHEWASILQVPMTALGSQTRSFLPSPVPFVGSYVTGSANDRARILETVSLLPHAGQVSSNMSVRAANRGDRLKQALLLEILARTVDWPTITYVETHAGAGVYGQAQQKVGQHIMDLQFLVGKAGSSAEAHAGAYYLCWLKQWWRDPRHSGLYPGCAVTAQRWLKDRGAKVSLRATESDPVAARELRRWIHGEVREDSFQKSLDWLMGTDDFVMLVDPFVCVQSFVTGEGKRRLERGWLDHKTIRSILRRCENKNRAILSIWWGYGRSPVAAKSNEPTCSLLRAWAREHNAAYIAFEDGHNHTNAIIGIGGGADIVRDLPRGVDWRQSWLRETVFERKAAA